MNVFLEFKSGASQESYDVRDVRIDDGKLLLDGRRVPLDDVKTMRLGGPLGMRDHE